MNNYEIEQRIKELEQEIKSLKAECTDPMLKMRLRREDILTVECDFPKWSLSSNFGAPLLMLIRSTARISPAVMKQINDGDDWDLFYSMQDELLSVVVKYSKIFKDRKNQKNQLASVKLEELYSAAREYKRAKQFGYPRDEEFVRFNFVLNSLINAGYTKAELSELIRENP